MADENTSVSSRDAQSQQDAAGPAENEMPDPQAIEERVQSGADRQSAEAAFGGQAEGEVASLPTEGGRTDSGHADG